MSNIYYIRNKNNYNFGVLMSLYTYLSSDFDYPHERELFTDLRSNLEKNFKDDKNAILIGNININGKELDGLFIKNNAIIVLEFKNYNGKLRCYENGSWFIDDQMVLGGSTDKNPYQQVRSNRYVLINRFSNDLSDYQINFGHISTLIIFKGNIEIVENKLPNNIEPWFYISDNDEYINKLAYVIGSNEININDEQLLEIPKILNLDGCEFNEQLNVTPQKPIDYANTQDISISNHINNDIVNILNDLNFNIVYNKLIPSKRESFSNIEELNLSETTKNYLSLVNSNIYKHQYYGIKLFKEKNNICINTSTGSGKSLIFYANALEILSKDPTSKILAIYPQKALGYQQEQKWKEAVNKAGLNEIIINRIDGSINFNNRPQLLEESNIIIMTPDVIHAWLLNYLEDNKSAINLLKMIVVDEVHNYKGVFGTNSAFLFRRLNHSIKTLSDNLPQYITASATIADPELFHKKLFGLDFEIIDNSFDSSPKNEVDIILVEPNNFKNLYNDMIELVQNIYQRTDLKFIEFVDSRKMTEQLALAVNREIRNDNYNLDNQIDTKLENLQGVYPYRAGYLSRDSEDIFNALQNNNLRGVVSTSSLEIGIDIGDLNLGILWGIPASSTSLYQRIGRFGRNQNGTVVIVNDGSFSSSHVFNKPNRILNLPIIENSFYLDNDIIQYIHAYCFTSQTLNGEYDQIQPNDANNNANEMDLKSDFPESFKRKCINIRTAQETSNPYNRMVSGYLSEHEAPHYTFPLSDVEKQSKLIDITNRNHRNYIGEISYDQIIREAYPGAIYYHQTIPYRVTKIVDNYRERNVYLHKARNYTTKPMKLPSYILPDFTETYNNRQYGDLIIIESNLTIVDRIKGYLEQRGNTKTEHDYPNDYYHRETFQHRYITTGVILHHPSLDDFNNLDVLAKLLLESFLINIPFDRQDVNSGSNRFLIGNNVVNTDNKFISIYDETYGSLRLTNKLTNISVLKKVLKTSLEIINNEEIIDMLNNDYQNIDLELTKTVLNQLMNSFNNFNQIIEIQNNDTIRIFQPNTEVIYNNETWRIQNHYYDNISNYIIQRRFENHQPRPITRTLNVPEYDLVDTPNTEYSYFNIETGETFDEISE